MPGQDQPTKRELRIAREADEYREYMVLVWMRRGLSEEEARQRAEDDTQEQVALGVQRSDK